MVILDEILEDGIVTNYEIISLQSTIKAYLDSVNTSPITLSTQILNGIIKGISFDNMISESEIRNLRQWLYDNIYLEGHFPFDKLLRTMEDVVEDSVITENELNYVKEVINGLLDPVEEMREAINSVENKVICLSGNFEYGEKSDVERYILKKGGSVVSGVSKKIDYLIIGNLECQAYSNGTYGTKVKKAIELNEKGLNIKIIKESDLFGNKS